MRFLPEGSLELRHGRFLDQGPATVLVDDQGWIWAPAKVRFVVPDDEAMSRKAQTLGYAIHTPLSVQLVDHWEKLGPS